MGMRSLAGSSPVRSAMRSTTGMKMATTPVLLMREPSRPTASMMSRVSNQALLPPRSASQSPTPLATPVRARASPTTNMAPMSTMLELLKPAMASPIVMMPVKGSTSSIMRATASARGRLRANMRIAAARRRRTPISS